MTFLQSKSAKSSLRRWRKQVTGAIAGVIMATAAAIPSSAAILEAWEFDPTERLLTITLPADVTPRFFLLAEPARIVLIVPETTLEEDWLAQSYAGAIRTVRLAEVEGNTRIVLELASNTLLDPRHAQLGSVDLGNGLVRWTLQPLIEEPASGGTVHHVNTNADVDQAATDPDEPSPSPSAAAEDSPSASPAPTVPPQAAEPVTAAPASVPVDAPQSSESLAEPAAEPILSPLPAAETVPEPGDASADNSSQQNRELHLESAPPSPVEADSEPISQPTVAEPPIVSRPTPRAASSPTPAAPISSEPVQSVTTTADTLQDVSTDASALAGIGAEVVSDPAALPGNPEGLPGSATAVSVPPLASTPTASSPQVAVPSLADVPEVTAVPAPASSTPAADDSATAPVPAPLPEAPQAAPPQRRLESPPASNADTQPRPSTRTPAPPASVASAPPQDPSTAEPASPTSATIEAPTPPPFLSGQGLPPVRETQAIPPPPNAENGVVPFGAPLPLKSLEGAIEDGGDFVTGRLPVGTRLVLQYQGTSVLSLESPEPWYEVLVIAEDVRHPDTQERLLVAGTPVLGRFEGFDDSGRRFVAQVIIEGSDRTPLLAESDWLLGSSQRDGSRILTNSGIGAAVVTVLSGFSGIGLLGGAALGAVSGFADSPRLVQIEPGQTIEVEVVSDILPFHETSGSPDAP